MTYLPDDSNEVIKDCVCNNSYTFISYQGVIKAQITQAYLDFNTNLSY